MPDASLKMTVFFNAQAIPPVAARGAGSSAPATGWTETWWLQGPAFDTGPQNPPGPLATLMQNYCNARVPLLGIGATLSYVRCSLPLPQPPALLRASQILVPNANTGVSSNFTQAGVDDYDPTQVDLMIRVQAGAQNRRVAWLGGLPDSQTDTFQVAGILPSFLNGAAFTTWLRFVTQNFYIRDQVKPHTTPKTFVANAITAVIAIQVRNRKRGRPFNLFRGRRAV